MDEETEQTASAEPAPEIGQETTATYEDAIPGRKELPQNTKMFIFAGGVLLLLLLQAWFMDIRARGMEDREFGHSVDAVAAASVQIVLSRSTERARQFASQVTGAAGYSSITLTDTGGTGIASSSSPMEGKVFEELKKPPSVAKVTRQGGKRVGYRAIVLGSNNVIGGIWIESN